MIQITYRDLGKQRQQQAMDLSGELQGERLNLGKKISIPQDVMMEELKLQSNRGSRMFQERLKRVERFTLENAANRAGAGAAGQGEAQGGQSTQEGKENFRTELIISPSGKHSLVSTLKHTVANKGSPDVLAPGYSGPLKEIPHEKFNVTVIPKSYRNPWREDLSDSEKLLATLNVHLPEPPQKLTPPNYKCFNRVPIPFGGTAGSMRIFPLPGFELLEAYTEPCLTWERMCQRPNFNRVPRGWGTQYTAESAEL
ncbi:hypothetical protein MATL_G00050630 [Megalops atlanticus]|uniref:Myozenin-3 n=1 Tax=Megalops atlanticus TaxID=7932 RepID=A0A9D3QDZ2_MEGAT|nr:hypothetical protein MATL_G00050630 [Megalops atlanticus]